MLCLNTHTACTCDSQRAAVPNSDDKANANRDWNCGRANGSGGRDSGREWGGTSSDCHCKRCYLFCFALSRLNNVCFCTFPFFSACVCVRAFVCLSLNLPFFSFGVFYRLFSAFLWISHCFAFFQFVRFLFIIAFLPSLSLLPLTSSFLLSSLCSSYEC